MGLVGQGVIVACVAFVLAGGRSDLLAQTEDPSELPVVVQLVSTNSPYAFFKGLELPSDPPEAWQVPGFDDSGWFQDLFSPFSYGESLEFGTILEDMQGNYSTFLLRHPFEVTNPKAITELVVNAVIDDGFIAWINGHEILRVNVAEQAFGVNYTASTVPEPVPNVRYEIEVDDDWLLFGENVLAVQVVNGNIVSSDILFEMSLDGIEGVDDSLPPIANLEPAKVPELKNVFPLGEDWRFFRGTAEPSNRLGEWRSADFDDSSWEQGTSPLFYGEDVLGGTLLEDMFGNYSTVYLRRPFTVEAEQLNRGIEVSALIDDGLIVWINGQEVGRAAVDRGDLPFDSEAELSAVEPLQPVILRGPPNLLQLGTNWIAVQALNGSPFSSDFFIDLQLDVVDAPIIAEGGLWRFFPGDTDPSLGRDSLWYELEYDDRDWSLGLAPFVTVPGPSAGTVVPGMLGQFGSVYLRKSFFIDHPELIDELELELEIRHGASLWLNGSEIQRVNLPEGPLNTTVLASGIVTDEEDSSIVVPSDRLIRGENVVAIQAVNADLGRSDFRVDLSLEVEGVDATTPGLIRLSPSRGTVSELSEITLEFSEKVLGIEASDLTVNGLPARDVLRSATSFTFLVDEPESWPARVVFAPRGPLLDLAPVPNFFPHPRTEWGYEREDQDPPTLLEVYPLPGSGVLAFDEVELVFSEAVSGVEASSIQANGQTAQSIEQLSAVRYRVGFDSITNQDVVIELVEGGAIMDSFGNALAAIDPWSYRLIPQAANSVIVSELVTANATGLQDEEGDPEDWIELYNSGSLPVNLSGWALSDSLENPRKWLFPDTEIAAGAYMVVFASGKDRRDPQGANLHTNFRLSRGGERVILVRPDRPILINSQSPDPLPELRDGVSFGLGIDGEWKYFQEPSPGMDNGTEGIIERSSVVEFNVPPGQFELPFHLTLSTDDRGAVIRYSIDGSEPTEKSGQIYSGPFRVAETTIVRAASFRAGTLPSKTVTRSYLFENVAGLGEIPIFSLSTALTNVVGPSGILGIGGGEYVPRGSDFVWAAVNEGDYHNPTSRGRAWERPVSVEYFDPLGGGFQLDGGFRVHGSVFARPKLRSDSKFGFRLYFRSSYDDSAVDFPVIPESGREQVDRIVLRSGHNDFENPFISDELARRLSSNMGRLTARGGFSNVFLNGVYQGYYNHTERIAASSLKDWFGGGDEWDIVKPFAVLSEGDLDEWDEMIEFFSAQDLALPANFLEANRHLDLEAFADYLLANIYSDTGDWVRSNWRAVREDVPEGQFRFLVWDAEFSFGIYGRPVDKNTLELPGELGIPTFITLLFDQLKQNEEFRLLFADQVQKHFFNGGALTDEAIRSTFERTRDEVISVIPEFRNHIEETWIPGRRGFMLEDLEQAGLMKSRNAPVMNQHGGAVFAGFGLSLENTEGGTIFYTLDGSDPRVAFRNLPSASASSFDGNAIVLTETVTVSARTLKDGAWSALNRAVFNVGVSDSGLSITELLYHPADKSWPEFVEVMNRGGEAIDLSGASFSGIEFEFETGSVMEPGEIWVLVRTEDALAFGNRFPNVSFVGLYDGKLSNGGEQIKLSTKDGAYLAAVNYDDENAWPSSADGEGPSLELRRLDADPNDATQWRASLSVGGSPGVFTPVGSSSIQFSEVFVPRDIGAGESFVEIFNGGAASVDLSAWTVESVREDSRLFEFAPDQTLDSGQRIVVSLGVADPLDGELASQEFLHPEEDTAILRDASGEIVDSIRYGDHVPSLSFVREDAGLWTLGIPSPGRENLPRELAASSQFIINEWLSNPAQGDDDWFEVYNADLERPGRLEGVTFSDGESFVTLRSLIFVPAGGFVRLWADNGRGPDHFPFRLASSGGTIALFDEAGDLIDRIEYLGQSEGQSTGRFPDGAESLVVDNGGGSPGESNDADAVGGLVFSEVLWVNESAVTGPHGAFDSYFEISNEGASAQSLEDVGVRVESDSDAFWRFPNGSQVLPGERRVVWLGRELPPSSEEDFYFDSELRLTEAGGRLELIDRNGLVLDSIQFGHQLVNQSLGRDSLGWGLRQVPSPGTVESDLAELGDVSALRINEWAAANDGRDWIEFFNADVRVVDLGGLLVTDDPGLSGKRDAVIGNHTFVGPGAWVFLGDNDDFPLGAQTRLNFSLAREGEFIRLYDQNGLLIDAVDFDQQVNGRTEGRIPDGSGTIVNALMPSPGRSNVGTQPVDLDQDGIADDWELENGLDPNDPLDAFLDFDRDGVINLTEFVEGTNPNDEIEIIAATISLLEDEVRVRFNAIPDTRYQLEYTTDLGHNDWQILLELEADDDEEVLEISDASVLENGRRFYRIVRP